MEAELLGSSSQNLSGKGSQKLGPWQEGDVEVKEEYVFEDGGGRELFEHVCQVMDMIIQTGRSLREANLMTDPCVKS